MLPQCTFEFTHCRYDTTANTLTYAVYLLAQHPEVETQLVKEIRELDDGSPLDYSSVQKYKVHSCIDLIAFKSSGRI